MLILLAKKPAPTNAPDSRGCALNYSVMLTRNTCARKE